MNEERLGSARAFAEELGAHLAALAERGPILPSTEELVRLVELSFFASLHEEEARRSEFTLAWTGGAQHCTAAVALQAPVVATPKTIAKLAPAARREATSLALRRDGSELSIWALLQHGASVALPLTIRAIAPGVLRVDYLGVPRALYARGEILFLGAVHEVRSPARRLTEAFSRWAGSAPGVDARAATVTRIAARALAHGHGGMILLVPTGVDPRGVRMHYAAGQGADLLGMRYAALVDGLDESEHLERVATSRPHGADGRANARDRAQIQYDEAIDFVASLTATDNALLLDTDLRVLGFGVQVIEGEAPLEPFAHVNPYTGDAHVDDITTFKGTRHPAGVIFCLRQEGEAAAIIASQDGRLSLVTKDASGKVEVLGSYERAFGWR